MKPFLFAVFDLEHTILEQSLVLDQVKGQVNDLVKYWGKVSYKVWYKVVQKVRYKIL